MRAISALLVADHFLALGRESGTPVTHLKLQKLLYFAQGYHLAITSGQSLFDDSIQAWKFGPVIPAVYHRFKECKNEPISSHGERLVGISQDTADYLKNVWTTFSPLSAIHLSNLSHEVDGPWDIVVRRNGGKVGLALQISNLEMQEFFKRKLR